MITVTFSETSASTVGHDFTLQEVIDAINQQSQTLGNDQDGNSKDYAMASAYYNSTANAYYLKVSSRLTTADTATMTFSTNATTVASGAIVADSVQTDLDITDSDATDAWADGSSDFSEATGTGVNITTTANAETALLAITTAITTKDTARAAFGYKMNRLESTIAILDIQSENLMAAESRISDVDVAIEMATLTRTQVLAQAGISMLSQANTMPQMALTLLR
ncbi:MAG: hypothetical protein FVQ79_11875 [Planctomycetes bacterium]|nr:hypothetical protein [Planctomycetota bacterium]